LIEKKWRRCDYVLYDSDERPHLQRNKIATHMESPILRMETPWWRRIRKIDNEIYERIVKDESGTGFGPSIFSKSIFLTWCSVSPEGLIDAARVKLKWNFFFDEVDDRNLITDNLVLISFDWSLITTLISRAITRWLNWTDFEIYSPISWSRRRKRYFPAKRTYLRERCRIVTPRRVGENYLIYEREERVNKAARDHFARFIEKFKTVNNWWRRLEIKLLGPFAKFPRRKTFRQSSKTTTSIEVSSIHRGSRLLSQILTKILPWDQLVSYQYLTRNFKRRPIACTFLRRETCVDISSTLLRVRPSQRNGSKYHKISNIKTFNRAQLMTNPR